MTTFACNRSTHQRFCLWTVLTPCIAIIQMPPGIPVATVAINGAMNAAILAVQMLALSNTELADTFAAYKEGLKKKIVKANEELKEVKFEYKTN